MRRAIAVTILVLMSACTPGDTSDAPSPTATSETKAKTGPSLGDTGDANQPQVLEAALHNAGDCDALLTYFVEQALEQVGPWGLHGGFFGRDQFFAMDDSAAEGGETFSQASLSGSSPSATNVQVEGVDEADIVKAVDDVLFVIADQRLLVFSTAAESVERLASLDLGEQAWGSQILVHEDTLLVMGAGSSMGSGVREPTASTFIPISSSFASVTFVDISDPAQPSIDRRLTMDGHVVASRLAAGHLRVVLQAEPVGLAWSFPEGSGLRAEREATERNRQIVRESRIENWLPFLVTSDGEEQVLLDCEDVLLPPEPSGLGTLSILDFDIDAGSSDASAAAVVASGSTVYANLDRVYVATSRWLDPVLSGDTGSFDGHITRIHRFDTPVDGDPTYVASGEVDGFLLNQFALDEYEGDIRVASTTTPPWRGEGSGEPSQSSVTVLTTEANRLVEVGQVDGLGITETIRAVRFMGPIGYVVTFRQTDPLYVIDLSDHTNPVAAGELKIPGFSSYLHPVGEGRLLGVGQDADEESGRVRGLQLSLFDVSNPSNPQRLDTFALETDADATESHVSSPIEHDHKAFTLHNGVGFVPYEGFSWSEGDQTEKLITGVIEVDWTGDSFDGTQTLSVFSGDPLQDEWSYAPQRTVVKGDVAYAIGRGGLTIIDLGEGEILDQLRF